MKELSISPKSQRFTMHQEAELVDRLNTLDSHSMFHEISQPEDVTLDVDGRVNICGTHFRYTHNAFAQLCGSLSGFMCDFVRDLSGSKRTIKDARGDFSFDEAVQVVNRVIQRRFQTRLLGKKMMRNIDTETIDGIMGANYHWLPNVKLYEMVKAAASEHPLSPEFYEATLNGRWLALRFCCRKPYATLPAEFAEVPDSYFAGFHFSNDEVGRSAIRGAAFLLRKRDRTSAMTAFGNKRTGGPTVRHAGNSVEARVGTMIADVFKRLEPASVYEQRLSKIFKSKLGFSQQLNDEDEIKVREKIAVKLTYKRELPRDLAKKCITSAALRGSYEDEPADPYGSPVERTMYDLFNAIGREAKGLSIRHRESAEQLAYALLMGTFHV